MTPLQTPVVNMNGNTASSLIEQLKGVMTALDKVLGAMSNASDIGHGRNFQTLADGQAKAQVARDAWHERMRTINELHDEVMALALEIQKQGER